ncbi:CDP-Glycerol:Poly(glycerophosphate) glycerophosphotransferase [Fibrobacter sp. UWH9]|uniref:CDP-glycerol glycerophosphotransferase family protein n=1 Tax=unclassified Fibrobacter TaxID=2634177 RepID=UPI0009200D0E|nr:MULTISPECIES: CDP-glycerol glycerophosphotransferase family protein [unclassified Fibrobacter]OWV02734.1 hypothetical protein B7993_14800 [Fibrobacter sp. UWH3]SHH64445.1 CDP-Glycerol:Poly(glycerophosphate) glycerophosphotransferase [Fibrobacter sp. UWH9]SHK73279.1 CDP-Glycerol:Poly(glycerophosphate) glycerophosphotransferase [Fibrobacter sp. UWH6]
MFDFLKNIVARCANRLCKKQKNAILFYPHGNCRFDGYDILNGESDNVLCLLNDMLQDSRFKDFHFFVVYYHKDRLKSYQKYCEAFHLDRIHFVLASEKISVMKAVFKCYTIFTDTDFTRICYRVSTQRVVCLNYFGGLIKNEFFRIEEMGGYKSMIREQNKMHYLFDYHLSISDICSKFIALDNCHYYGNFLSLGFPRNDVLFKDHLNLKSEIEKIVGFKFKKIITYVPTHRDYENSKRSFYNEKNESPRSIWGHVCESDLVLLEKMLEETETLVVAKVHPVQQAQTSVIVKKSSRHVLFYSDLVENVKTSLNPLLAISDSIITDYTTTVYDFLYLNRPIIYYFYDYEQYRSTRGFFVDPIEPICAGHITYNMQELILAIQDICLGKDPEREKRLVLQKMFIKYLDNKACTRIKEYFFRDN